MSEMNSVDKILGMGETIDILDGFDEETNKPKIVKYYLCPAPLSKIKELFQLINEFSSIQEFDNDKFIEIGAKIIKISTDKVHPNLTLVDIKSKFDLPNMAKSIRIVMGMNDFLSEMAKITNVVEKVQEVNKKNSA